MAVFLLDTFTDADGTDLSAHVGETGASSVKLYVPSIAGLSGASAVDVTVLDAGQADQSVRVELSNAQTALLSTNSNPLYAEAVLADGHIVTPIAEGSFEGVPRVS